METIKKIQEIIKGYGTACSHKRMAETVYFGLVAAGINACLTNSRYIGVDDSYFQLIRQKSKGTWAVRAL